MTDLARLNQELAELQAQGAELESEREPGTDLVLAGSAEAVKAHMEDVSERLRRHHVLVQAKVAEVQMAADQQRREMERMMRDAERALEPIKAAMREVGEQIKTIGLYLGTGERIVELRDGESAPADTPITVRQLVLRMDEEAAAAQPEEDLREGGWDFQNMARFDGWLLEDPAHLEQVLPERKGVVCFTPRDPAKSKPRDSMGPNPDATMYWLIRNGERLYRTTTDFAITAQRGEELKLVPGPNTLMDLFTYNGRPVRPGSIDWDRAQERVNEAERMYFRVQVILEGLLHRTPVFEPIPTEGLSFMDEAHHEAGRVRFVLDAEASLTDGSETFREWQQRLNSQLRVGSRIVGGFGYEFGRIRHDRYRHEHPLLSPGSAESPDTGVIYELELVQGRQLGFRYERSERVWDPDMWVPETEGPDGAPPRPNWGHRGGYRKPKQRASCVVHPDDDWIIAYDLAEEADLRRFIGSRINREEYVDMLPLLRSCLRAKRRERELEEPFRLMLAGVLARENGVTVAEAEAVVPDLVDWFKLTNKRHRPLLIDTVDQSTTAAAKGIERIFGQTELPTMRAPQVQARLEERGREHEAKAVRLIVAEHARRLKIERSKPNTELVDGLRTGIAGIANASVMVGRRRSDGKYIVVIPERSDEDVWATVVTWGARKGLDTVERWQLLSSRTAASWQVLWAHERWERWVLNADPREHLSDPEREQLADEAVEALRAGKVGNDTSRRKRKLLVNEEATTVAVADSPVLGVTLETHYGEREVTLYVLEQEPVMPSAERPLREPGEGGTVGGYSVGWRRKQDGTVELRRPKYWAEGWRQPGSRWNSDRLGDRGQRDASGDPWGSKALVLRRDRELIARLRVQFQAYWHAARQRDALADARWKLERTLGREWDAAWWENERQKFIAEYGKPELWEGQRKVIEDKLLHRGGRERQALPTGGVSELLTPFVERGEHEQLWGLTVAEVLELWDAADGEPPKLDESILGLAFKRETGPEPDEDEWANDDGEPVEFDVEGSIVVAGELPAPEPEDAEVVE